jgi:energy-coupling factor transporter ATP-binding protein EcfA2
MLGQWAGCWPGLIPFIRPQGLRLTIGATGGGRIVGTARQDFERFVRWIHVPERQAPDGARKMAALVLTQFDAVAATARQHNSRSRFLATIARQHLAHTAVDVAQMHEAAVQGQLRWRRLHRLTLGPFRGFRHVQMFDLSRRVVLCYGPNGSGKSSLCEALEYALLGAVEEASSRRLEQRDYLANIHEGRFVAPDLTAIGLDGREMRVSADEDAFRFFFVEKNRIDNFSRLAAAPPGRRKDLISTLFGMDQFNDFAAHFNESMDPALTLGTRIQAQLATQRQAMRADEDVRDGVAEAIRKLDEEAADYAGAIAQGLAYDALRDLVGSSGTPGRLQELDTKLNQLLPAITGCNRERLAGQFARVVEISEHVAVLQDGLEQRRKQVSFRNLFLAVQSLRGERADQCPACLTPIENVASDPFERAEAGLVELNELAQLEAQFMQARRELDEAARQLRTELRSLEEFLLSEGKESAPPYIYLHNLAPDPAVPGWWVPMLPEGGHQASTTPSLDQLLQVAENASVRDALTRDALQARESDLEERARLNEARLWIAEHESRRASLIEGAAQANARIAEWEASNAGLILQADEEARANARDRPIKESYDAFYEYLERFRSQLPSMFMVDLNAVILDLYNEFNHDDRDEDKLAGLRMPLMADGTIDISFRGNPQGWVNALTVLSEGHIRCLGLAILLAKALSLQAPLIIFDDAINAIDHDHRSGIRRAIFESERFRDTQIIVTCHSPEFVKDINNNLPREQREDCRNYVLLHHLGDHQPRVNPNADSQNYLARAREAIDEQFDPRNSLSFARKSLEMLTHRAWKWLESHRVGNISVVIEGPGKEPQLRTLCEALRAKLGSNSTIYFDHPSKQPLLDNLNLILGIPEPNLIWVLLNKGAHEEPNRDDFDIDHVRTVLAVLANIDDLELRPSR